MLGRILVFLAGLVVIALFAALLAPYFIDWTGFRQDFERRASIILGKKVVVHGTVSARLLPFPSVTMNDVTVGQDEGGQPLVSARRFAMDMEVAPFLSGEARIFEMRIVDPKVRITLQKDGSLDWVRTGNPSIPTKIVVLENVRVSGGELIFEDHQTGRTRHFTGLDFAASAKSLAGPWHFDGRGDFDGVKTGFVFNTGSREADGSLRLSAHIAPDALPVVADLEGALKMQDLRLRYDGSFVAAYGQKDDAAAPARIRGAFELANDRVRLPEYRLELGDPKDPYAVTGEATLDTGQKPEFLLTAEGQQVDMNALGASGEEGKRGRNEQVLTASQRLQAFLSLLADIPVPPVPGKAELKLPAIVSGDTSFRSISVVAEPYGTGWKIDKASVELPGRTQVEANGVLNLAGNRSFDGALTIATNQPSGLSAWLAGDVSPEIRNLAAAGFSADVSLTDSLQRFENLELAAGGAILKGRAERQSPKEGQPSISLDLAGGDLDFNALKALVGLVTGKETEAGFFSHAIAARLAIKNLAAYGAVARDFDTAFALKDGKLAVDRLKIGDLDGAAIDMHGNASGSLDKPQFAFKGSFRSGDPRPFLLQARKYLPGHPILSALTSNSYYFRNARFDFDLSAGGGGDWPVTAALAGNANGTDFNLKLSAEDIALSEGTNLSLDLSAENDDYAVLFGQAGMKPLASIDGGHAVAGLTISRTGRDPADIALNFTGDTTGFNIKGAGDLSAQHFLEGQYKLLLDSDDLEPLLILEGYGLPQMGTGLRVAVSSSVDVTPGSLNFAGVTGKIESETVKGALKLTRGTSPTLTGDLALDNIDAGWLAELVAGPLHDENGVFSDKAIMEPGEGPFDAALTLSAKQFWMGYPLPLSDFKGKFTYSGGTIGLTDATGNFGGGEVRGTASLTATANQGFLRASLDVKSADLREFSWHSAQDVPVLVGRGDMTLRLESSGKSIKQLAGQLSGSGALSFPALDINGLNAGALPSILKGADAIEGDITTDKVLPIALKATENGSSSLHAVRLPFSIASGKLRIESAVADAGTAMLTLDGETGLTDSTISGKLRVAFKPGDDAIAGAEPAETLKLGGTLKVPSVGLDIAELTNYLSLRAFERERRKADKLQAELAEKQRLRREAMYFKSLSDAREKARIEAEQKAALEAELARQAAEKAAAEKAASEGEAQAPADGGQVIKGNGLPAPVN